MPLERAMAYALAAPALSAAEGAPSEAPTRRPRPPPALIAPGAAEALTPREREVARLIATGCRTDRQIAARLTITPGTAGVHVEHVLEKLGLHSRWQIAGRMLEQSHSEG
jgi:DNA-binding NarL/FixJ family response regulator